MSTAALYTQISILFQVFAMTEASTALFTVSYTLMFLSLNIRFTYIPTKIVIDSSLLYLCSTCFCMKIHPELMSLGFLHHFSTLPLFWVIFLPYKASARIQHPPRDLTSRITDPIALFFPLGTV